MRLLGQRHKTLPSTEQQRAVANKMVSVRKLVNTESFCKVKVRLILKNAHRFSDMEVKDHLDNSRFGKLTAGKPDWNGSRSNWIKDVFQEIYEREKTGQCSKGIWNLGRVTSSEVRPVE